MICCNILTSHEFCCIIVAIIEEVMTTKHANQPARHKKVGQDTYLNPSAQPASSLGSQHVCIVFYAVDRA